MRILVLNWKDMAHPFAGGAEVYTDEITRAWSAAGHDVTWFCASVAGRPAEETVGGVRIVRHGGRFGVYRAARLWYARHGAGRFDLVIDEVNTRPFLAVRYVSDTPVVALIHQVCREIWWLELPFPIALIGRFFLERRWLACYVGHPVLTVSRSSQESLAQYGLAEVTVVAEGLRPLPRPVVHKEPTPTVIFVGRLAKNKRPAAAIKAHALLRREVPDATLWVVGDGPQGKRLRARGTPGVTFYGRVDDIEKRELMARAHVLCATSVREGWGLVVDEAAAMGTRTVAYDVPGLRDSTTAAGGTLVAPNPRDMARGLKMALRQPLSEKPFSGGAIGWNEVADQVLSACVAVTTTETNADLVEDGSP